MATGSKRHKNPNSDTPVADIEVSQSGRLLNYRESLNLKVEKPPEPITVIKLRPAKLVEVADSLPLASGYLPSARDLGYIIPEGKREFDLRPPLKRVLLKEKRDFVIRFLKDAKPETLEKFFNLAVEEAGAVPAGLDVSKAESASPSPTPAPRAPDAPPLWAERSKDDKSSCLDWLVMHYCSPLQDGGSAPISISREELRSIDFSLYCAFKMQLSRLKKSGQSLPVVLQPLLRTAKDRVSQELKELGISDPKDAYRVLANDPKKANRLYQAALNRT